SDDALLEHGETLTRMRRKEIAWMARAAAARRTRRSLLPLLGARRADTRPSIQARNRIGARPEARRRDRQSLEEGEHRLNLAAPKLEGLERHERVTDAVRIARVAEVHPQQDDAGLLVDGRDARNDAGVHDDVLVVHAAARVRVVGSDDAVLDTIG